jgi:hypothetical protein
MTFLNAWLILQELSKAKQTIDTLISEEALLFAK